MGALRNIGIFAHVDAGKTTLTERLLAHAGAIRNPGSVDQGTAHTDSMAIERQRGISVRAGWARLEWKGVSINLIDTPGHVDFAAEVERALWAMDGAVLLLSAAEGVQPQSEVLFEALRENHVPTLIFVNKTDREGADAGRVMDQARRLWAANIARMESPEQAMEALAELDEGALDDYLAGTVYGEDRLFGLLAPKVREREILPALSGSALKDQGVEALLDAIVGLLPEPQRKAGGLCGVVFAVRPDKAMGRAAYVRMFSGALHTRDALDIPAERDPVDGTLRMTQKKITQIRALALDGKGADIGALSAGEIGVVYGLGEAKVGQVLGDEALLPRKVAPGSLQKPMIMVRAQPEKPEQITALRQALMELDAEDPMLGVQWSNHTRELTLSAMGAIQLEVLSALVLERYGLKMSLGAPQVIYRETIAQSAHTGNADRPAAPGQRRGVRKPGAGQGHRPALSESGAPGPAPGAEAGHVGLAGDRRQDHPDRGQPSPDPYPPAGFHRGHAHGLFGRTQAGRQHPVGAHAGYAHHRARGLRRPADERYDRHARGDHGERADRRAGAAARPGAGGRLHGLSHPVGRPFRGPGRHVRPAHGLSGMPVGAGGHHPPPGGEPAGYREIHPGRPIGPGGRDF